MDNFGSFLFPHLKIIEINDIINLSMSFDERSARCRLAALFHMLRGISAPNSIYDQIIFKLNDHEFLVNQFGLISEISASKLLKIDSAGALCHDFSFAKKSNLIFPSFSSIFFNIFNSRPEIKCIINFQILNFNLLTNYSEHARFNLKGVDACFLGEISYIDFSGVINTEFLNNLKNIKNKIVVLKNFFVFILADSVEEAFFLFYHLNRACEFNLKIINSTDKFSSSFNPASFYESDRSLPNLEFEAHVRNLTDNGVTFSELEQFLTVEPRRGCDIEVDASKARRNSDSGVQSFCPVFDDDKKIAASGSPSATSLTDDRVPSSESSKELLMRLPSPDSFDEIEDNLVEDVENCEKLSFPASRRTRGGKETIFMKRSRSLTSGVERAIFRKFHEKIMNERK